MELAHQMWDEARHIEVVAKACEEELGAELGYGPWSLVWWWMQNEEDPLKRIAVTNGWAEANLMHTLREWRTQAEKRGYSRIAELVDYLQADELTHVKLGSRWIRQLTADDPAHRDELVTWSRKAVDRVTGFFGPPEGDEARFTFLKSGDDQEREEPVGAVSRVIGE